MDKQFKNYLKQKSDYAKKMMDDKTSDESYWKGIYLTCEDIGNFLGFN